MDTRKRLRLHSFLFMLAALSMDATGITLTNPIVFITQPPVPREANNITITNCFSSVVTEFGNQQPDTAHAGRGGDLWLMTTNLGLVNLTRKAGFGASGNQSGVGIDVRDPAIYWDGSKVLFSMVVGAPTNATDSTTFHWQLYELTNLAAVIADTNTIPVIVSVANQPTNYNNVGPAYVPGGRIIFMSDRPFNNEPWLYPQLDEYRSEPSVNGCYSLDPATGNLQVLEHLPSGGFNPFIDSFGRLIVTRWDHLIQDGSAAADRYGKTTNGSLNFLSEAVNSPTTQPTVTEFFPEPNELDTSALAQQQVNPDVLNIFMPWALDPDGGNEEILNHVGRHEISFTSLKQSFLNDTNLCTVTNLASRVTSGVISTNTNAITSFFQITEDPRTNGLYWGVAAQDISIFGGEHGAGEIVTLIGPPTLNPTNMVVTLITPASGAGGPNSLGLFRNPLPMSDGTLISAFTPTQTSFNSGYDTNTGTASQPVSQYHFRLMTLQRSGGLWTTNQTLTPGLTNVAFYWDGSTLVTNNGPLWELQPVEVHARPIPIATNTPVNPIEAQVFSNAGVDLATFQSDIAARGMALVVSRNVTARDDADRQQPYNLSIPGGVSTIANSGLVYSITHLQYMEADYLRGYTLGTSTLQPGRRVLATPMQATVAYNYPSTLANAPAGGTQLMSDGSQATLVPAGRAMTWQLTGTNNNNSVVKERYWITFRPGEVRTCANCHGINAIDQIGRPPPTNPPQALYQLLQYWRTNTANAYTLTVNNGSGGGKYGAGSILTLTANSAPYGQYFAQWNGPGLTNATSTNLTFTMPAGNAAVTVVFSNLPPPNITSVQLLGGQNLFITATAYGNQPWVLQESSNLAVWTNLSTNISAPGGLLQLTNIVPSSTPQEYYRLKSP